MPRNFGERLSSEQEEARLAMWRAGLTDRQIAAALGLKRDTVKRWRQTRGLAAHPEPRRPRSGVSRKPKAPTADPVTRAAATCDAMVRPRRLADRPKVISVDIGTGRLTVHRPDSWWPVWKGEKAS